MSARWVWAEWVAVVGALVASGCASGGSDASVARARYQTTADRRCASLAVCQEYLQKVRELVYENWSGRESLPPGTVLMGFRLDGSGNVRALRALRASSEELGESCRSAVAYASPFGLLPASLSFLDGEPITLELSVPPPVAGKARTGAQPTR